MYWRGMETENLAADDGRRLYPVALYLLRVAASAVPLPVNGWVLYEYYKLRQTLNRLEPLVLEGSGLFPPITQIVGNCGSWPLVVSSAGILAVIIYIWAAAQRALPIILATIGAVSLCVVAGYSMQIAREGAWKPFRDLRMHSSDL